MTIVTPLFLILSSILTLIIFVGVMSEGIGLLFNRYAPSLEFNAEVFMFWALSVWVGFTSGLAVMYMVLKF